MRTDPFRDAVLFVLGHDDNYTPLGAFRWLLVLAFALLLIANLVLLARNWAADPDQRRARHLYIWLARTLVGAMWFQGSLWKLPLPVSGGFRYWMDQIAHNAAFPAMQAFYADHLLPNLALLDPLAWLAETGFAVAFTLGLAARLGGTLAIAFAVNIWLGVYHNAAEWPWQYMFLILLLGFLVQEAAGRSLGLDALLRRRPPALLAGNRLPARVYRLAS
jgi:hypothetical protein